MKRTLGCPNPSTIPRRCSRAAVLFSILSIRQVEFLARIFFRANSSAILQRYHETAPYARLGAILTDSLVTCYVRHVARLVSSAGRASTRLYTNMHAPSLRADPTNYRHFECSHGAMCHAGDNVFTFASYVLRASSVARFHAPQGTKA